MDKTELLILGGGPGGYPAAFAAAEAGLNVTLVDEGITPGGVCLHRGCIPSKALLHVARLLNESREAAEWGIAFQPPRIDLDALRRWKQSVVEKLTKGVVGLCEARGVRLIAARGRFLNSHSLELVHADGRRGQLSFENGIIATGSSPAIPAALQGDDPRVMDSTAALELPEVPRRLLIVGGGYIGLEMGTVYAALGSRVSVVEMTAGLLPGVDRDLVRPLLGRLQSQFEHIALKTTVEGLTAHARGITARLNGEDGLRNEEFDRVLIAVGRKPNSRELGLENTGVRPDERGFIPVDAQRRTADAALYAIGDVAGEPMLAHKATREAFVAVGALTGEAAAFDPYAIPAVVFTDPEVAWCGLTETEAKQQNRRVNVFRFPWAASGRAQTLGRTEGLTKLLADENSGRLLGMGVAGPGAGELIAEGVLAVELGATAADVARTIHAHPTLSETVMEAAEGLHASATHLFRKKRN